MDNCLHPCSWVGYTGGSILYHDQMMDGGFIWSEGNPWPLTPKIDRATWLFLKIDMQH